MRFNLKQVTRSTTPAVSLAEMKTHLRIIGRDSQDDKINLTVSAATEYLERITYRTFVQTTYDMVLQHFPYGQLESLQPALWGRNRIDLPRTPVASVDSITYKNFQGVSVAFTEYYLDESSPVPCISTNPKYVWPFSDPQRGNAAIIRFTAGDGTVSPMAKIAIMQLAENWYETRSGVTEIEPFIIPYALHSIIGNLKYRL